MAAREKEARAAGRWRSALVGLASAAGMAASASAGEPPMYTATVIPQLDGSDVPITDAFAINDGGVVTGSFGFPSAGFNWSQGGGAQTFSSLYGFGSSAGIDINAGGQVVGWFQGGGAPQAFIGNPDGSFTALPRLVDDARVEAAATGVNDSGFAVGYGATEPNGGFGAPTHAVGWRDGSIIDMGTLGGFVTAATAVNNAGVAVGYGNEANVQQVRAFRWTKGGGMEPLERYDEGFVAMAWDVNDAGLITGAAEGLFNGEYGRAPAYWGPDGSLVTIPFHFDQAQGIPSAADIYAVNESMQMVGQELDPVAFVLHAMYWHEGESYVLSDYVADLPAGLRLDNAVDINEDGQVLVRAFDTVNIQFVSVLLTPVPAPAAGLVLGAGLLAAARRRR